MCSEKKLILYEFAGSWAAMHVSLKQLGSNGFPDNEGAQGQPSTPIVTSASFLVHS